MNITKAPSAPNQAGPALTNISTVTPDDPNGKGWTLEIVPHRNLLHIPLAEIWNYRDLLHMLVKRDIITVYKQTVLGPLWFFLQPILTMLVYVIVFGNIANISTDGIPKPLFYLSGIIIWNYFSDSLSRTSTTFSANADLFGKVYFPRLIMPLSLVASGLIKFLIQATLFLAVFIYFYFTTDLLHPNVWLLSTPYLVALMAGLGLGSGIIFSSCTTKYRDLTFLLQFGVQLLMYATPIIYPSSLLRGKLHGILWWNPISHIVETFRYAFLGEGEISLTGLAYSTAFTVITLIIGILIFHRTERAFIDTV